MSVLLDDVNDFIAPSQACVKPMQIDKKRTAAFIELEDGDNGQADRSQAAVAKVTLNDCLACSGCVTSAETVLISQQSAAEFWNKVQSGRTVFVSVSHAALASLAAQCGLSIVDTFSAMSAALRGLGCRHVVDCGLASDLSLLEAAAEFRERKLAADREGRPGRLPVLSSSCPGWVCYAEKMHGGSILPYLSTVKSAQQIMGTLVRHSERNGVLGHRDHAGAVFHAAVMPCFDKKLEASREDFAREEVRDVDCVLSTVEVLRMLEEAGVDLAGHKDRPYAPDEHEQVLCNVRPDLRKCRMPNAGAGGYCEFVYRTAARDCGVHIPDTTPLPWKTGRLADVHELELEVDGVVRLRFAAASGFRNIQNIVSKVKRGKCPYDYVELMACPSGCLNGGAQIRPSEDSRSARTERLDAVRARYHEDAAEHVGWPSTDDPRFQSLCAPGAFLSGGLMSPVALEQLHTRFHAVKDDVGVQQTLNIAW